MNIAILFSGMPRSFKTTYPNFIKNIINPLKNKGHHIDIIMHVWDNEYNYVKYMKDEGTISELISLYKPYHYSVEKYNSTTIKRLHKESNIDLYLNYIKTKNYNRKDSDHGDFIGGGPQRDNRISSFYSIEQTKSLTIEAEEKQNIKYDCIIKNRLDNQIFSPINLDIFSDIKNTVYSSMGYEGDDKHIDFTINDMFLVGDRDSMLKHLSLYSNLIHLLTLRFDKKHPKPFQPVGLTKHNLLHEGITNIKRFYLDHIVTRRLHKYKALNSVVTGDGWNIPVRKTNKIITECNRWI
jgi:hypothetical protein